ncbi:MAG TPA: IS66 family insertion sequence element accessory protein TnpB [Acidocella sp.]|nr:IS66 family insertion sequence element accessory protein TnpB [Acidocella sp.]
MIFGIPSRPGLRVMVASKPVDFRRGMDGLAAMVTHVLLADPFAGDVFIFRSKRTDRIKLILWDGSGLCLVTKRLEAGSFTWPPVQDGVVTLSAAQLRMLFSGMDWTQIPARSPLPTRPPMPVEKLQTAP